MSLHVTALDEPNPDNQGSGLPEDPCEGESDANNREHCKLRKSSLLPNAAFLGRSNGI